MSLAIVRTRALVGLSAPEVIVEAHLANGLPAFNLVGLPEVEVREARDRVRAAIATSRFEFPQRRITVNLAPADLPKEGGRFDLPIALGILAASGQVDAAALGAHEFAGELSLDGSLRAVRGALGMSLALRATGRALVVPAGNAAEAALAGQTTILPAASLLEVCAHLNGHHRIAPHVPVPVESALQRLPDLADVKGQAFARRALEVAAAGGHSLLMFGPPGTGKSMLAQRLPALLPPMDEAEALASAAVLSLSATGFDPARFGQRPVRAPHHSASAPALVGGGSPPRPGEISLAHGGVLFLDEAPELPRAALEALREPLETGQVTIARAARRATFPARFQLVAAMNPCPCGWLGATAALGRACRCTPESVARYQGRLSGPLLDRIDLQVEVLAAPAAELLALPDGEPSAVVASRVAAARERQLARQGVVNALLDPAGIDRHCTLDDASARFLRSAAERLAWSGRRLHRCLKVARTIADLAGAEHIAVAHVAEALQLQRVLAGA